MQGNFERLKELATDNDTIYHAALEKNKNKIQALVKMGGVIDELDSSLLSPAGRLAKEGNIEAAEFLRKWFGANVNAILHGATCGDHNDYADYLRLNHGASYISWVNTDPYEASKKLSIVMDQFYQAFKETNNQKMLENPDILFLFDYMKSHYYIENCVLYNALYHAAKELNTEKVKELFTSNFNNENLNLHFVASKLASEGFFEAAELLSKEPCVLVCGAAQGNQSAYVEPFHALIQSNRKDPHHRLVFNYLTVGYGIGGHKNYIDHSSAYYLPSKPLLLPLPSLLSRENYLMLIMKGLALNGHLNYLWTMKKEIDAFTRFPVCMDDYMIPVEKSGLFSNKAIALHSLAFIQSKDWKRIIASHCDKSNKDRIKKFLIHTRDLTIEELIPLRNFSVAQLIPKANTINNFMESYNLNYDEALAWLNPEIQTLLLQVRLPFDCLSLIITYLAPITLNDALILCSIMPIQTYKTFIINEFKKYVNNLDSGHTKRATSLIKACESITSKSALYDLLDAQKKIISCNRFTLFRSIVQEKHEELPKKPIQGKYLEIIERHQARL